MISIPNWGDRSTVPTYLSARLSLYTYIPALLLLDIYVLESLSVYILSIIAHAGTIYVYTVRYDMIGTV